ncbi:MAG: PD-(D/E)XK nuclease family protein [Candidatus Hodarchaeota archaeon]
MGSFLENKIKIIPHELPFLRVFAKYVCNKFKDDFPDFSSILIVFPSQRNKLYFRRYILECLDSNAFIPATMTTIDELMGIIYESLGGKKGIMLDNIERNFILKKIVDSLKIESWQDLPFLKFVSIGNRLLNFFDELSKERMVLEHIEEKVCSGHYPEKYVQNELFIIKKIYNEYKRHLGEMKYKDAIDKYNVIYNRFNADVLKEYKYIAIAGLVATTKVENKIIKEVLLNLPAELIIHSSQESIKKSKGTDSPFYLHGKLLDAIGAEKAGDIETIEARLPDPALIHIRRTETVSQQSFYLKNLLKKLKTSYKPHRIAIILADEATMYSVSEILKASGVEFNLSTGFPFTQSILYSFLNQLMNVIHNNCHYKEFFTFIRHPLFKNAVINKKSLRPLIYRLENYMIENRLNYFEFSNEMEDNLKLLVELIKSCLDVVQLNLPLNEYITHLIGMLNNLLSYNQELIKTNSPDINSIFDRLNNLSKLRITGKQIDPGVKMLEFILHALKDETFYHRGDPMKGVQVIGLLEARNLDFDCIIIPSMNEGVFPKRSEKDLFVNQLLRKEIGLPYDKERENLYLYYFTEMINGKKEVFISYVEEEKRDIRSRFIDLLREERNISVDETKMLLENIAIRISKREVKKDHDLLSTLLKKLSSRGLSPTNLRDYKECPYRFYLKYLLGVREPIEIIEEAGPVEWGSIIHKSLRNFYKYDFPEGISEEKLETAKHLLYKRLDDALKNELAQKPKRISLLDSEIYKRRLSKFLYKEIDRFKNGFRIVKEKIEKKIERRITISNTVIKLCGYPDRVDILDGHYYVLDYKSKAPPKKNCQIGDDFVEFQLPLYSLILSDKNFKNIGGLAYYEIAKETDIISVVEEDKNSVEQYLKDFKKLILLPTIKEILDDDVSFYQTNNQESCKYCNYIHLCGVRRV